MWCIDGSLKDAFPELYRIARVKDVGALKKKKKNSMLGRFCTLGGDFFSIGLGLGVRVLHFFSGTPLFSHC